MSLGAIWRSVREMVPLQRPGQPEVLRRVRVPAEEGEDRRVMLDSAALRTLLAMAESSVTQRVVLHGATLEVEWVRASNGHVWQRWTLLGHPEAEGSGRDVDRAVSVGGRGPWWQR